MPQQDRAAIPKDGRLVFFRERIFPVLLRHGLMNDWEADEYLILLSYNDAWADQIWSWLLQGYKNGKVVGKD
jgi:hypothetical protein